MLNWSWIFRVGSSTTQALDSGSLEAPPQLFLRGLQVFYYRVVSKKTPWQSSDNTVTLVVGAYDDVKRRSAQKYSGPQIGKCILYHCEKIGSMVNGWGVGSWKLYVEWFTAGAGTIRFYGFYPSRQLPVRLVNSISQEIVSVKLKTNMRTTSTTVSTSNLKVLFPSNYSPRCIHEKSWKSGEYCTSTTVINQLNDTPPNHDSTLLTSHMSRNIFF